MNLLEKEQGLQLRAAELTEGKELATNHITVVLATARQRELDTE